MSYYLPHAIFRLLTAAGVSNPLVWAAAWALHHYFEERRVERTIARLRRKGLIR